MYTSNARHRYLPLIGKRRGWPVAGPVRALNDQFATGAIVGEIGGAEGRLGLAALGLRRPDRGEAPPSSSREKSTIPDTKTAEVKWEVARQSTTVGVGDAEVGGVDLGLPGGFLVFRVGILFGICPPERHAPSISVPAGNRRSGRRWSVGRRGPEPTRDSLTLIASFGHS